MDNDESIGYMGGRRLSSPESPSSHDVHGSTSGTFGSAGSESSPTKLDRRHQFFEQSEYQDEAEVARLLTKATLPSNENKLENLMHVKDIIINKQPALLNNFLCEMLNFQTDDNSDIRCFILEFVEDACKADAETIPKVLPNMMMMLQDESVTVRKKAIQVTARLYKFTLMWLCRSKSVTEGMEAAWSAVCDLKKYVITLLNSDFDAIRTFAVKFIESVVLLQTPSEQGSFNRQNDFCLDDVPVTVHVASARSRKLEKDARNLFEELLKFLASRYATSVNLMTCMGSIVLISKMRPHLMGRVVKAMEKLLGTLPPTLDKFQVASVKKFMKVKLLGLLSHPRSIDFYDNITTLLTSLGATKSELYKALPNGDQIRAEKRKRQGALEETEETNQRKRARMHEQVVVLEDYDDDEDMEKPSEKNKDSLTELEYSIFEKLSSLDTVAEMVVTSMEFLPDTMPAHFMSAFTPISVAGTDGQIKHVSRLLAAQITAQRQLGFETALQVARMETHEDENEPTQIPSLVPGSGLEVPAEKEKKSCLFQPTVVASKKIPKVFNLSQVTKPLTQEERQRHLAGAVRRILQTIHCLNAVKTRLICSVAASSTFELRQLIMQHIQEDIKNRLDLGISWLYTEYCLYQDFISKSLPMKDESSFDRYEWTFLNLMKGILDSTTESEKTSLAWKLYLESPAVPDKGVDLLKALASQPMHAAKGMQIFLELTLKRPKKLYYLSALLQFCVHALEQIRVHAVVSIVQIYEKMESTHSVIEDQVQVYCNYLRLPNPPEILFTEDLGRGKETQGEWNDDLVKACLHLYLKLVNIKSFLIHELASVYVEATPDVKRIILRYVETLTRNMGMDSPEMMKLLDTFPKGAETFITKIIHILTDKTLPSADLVSRVRNLYAKRVSDVRFLIPVLNALTKQEILTALPKLIKLSPVVVKELSIDAFKIQVFNRLLGIHADAKSQHASPITPVELMVALHNIDGSKCDVKTVIKATSLCFNEREVYTPEVLAVVINQLLEQSPFPTLLMRTVIQTLALHHAKLSGFIMNALERLVIKQVWKQPLVWEGFVKCCQRTIPKSIPILLRLPATQLQQALEQAEDLRQPLANLLMSLPEATRSCMPTAILSVVLGNGESFANLKQEFHHQDNEEEDRAVEGGSSGPSSSLRALKNEPRYPAQNGELIMPIKEELQEFQDE